MRGDRPTGSGAGWGGEPGHSWEDYVAHLQADEEAASQGSAEGSGSVTDPDELLPPRVVVSPEEDDVERARRRRRRLTAAAVVALMAALAVLFLASRGSRRSGGEEAGGVATDVGGAAGGGVSFVTRAASVAGEIASFRERQRDFELNRIGCEGLARGLDRVRSAYSALAGALAAEGSDLDPASLERYRRLTEDVREIERMFVEAGCAASP